jgi:hypothetical protein
MKRRRWRKPTVRSARRTSSASTARFELHYRGRFDESRKETAPEGVRRDLYEAMKQIAQTQRGPAEQIPSMGCSIKWKDT